MSQNLRNFTRAVYVFDAVVRRMPEDAWAKDSPCDGWTGMDVLKHQCGVLDALAHIAATGELARPAAIEEDVTDPVARWGQTRDGVLAALDRPTSDLGLPVPHRLYNLGNDQPEQLMDIVEILVL